MHLEQQVFWDVSDIDDELWSPFVVEGDGVTIVQFLYASTSSADFTEMAEVVCTLGKRLIAKKQTALLRVAGLPLCFSAYVEFLT